MKKKELYEAPLVEVFEVNLNRVILGSFDSKNNTEKFSNDGDEDLGGII